MRPRQLCAALLALAAARAAAAPPCSTVADHSPEQAGYPPGVACYAKPGRTDKYDVGYVGGGCVGRCGEPRRPDDGTFGWDYVGCRKYGWVFLNWCHCVKQKPPGPYRTDGPPVPDVFSVKPLRRLCGAAEGRDP
jgi:hypothetical protein